jgi:hypothetical protein
MGATYIEIQSQRDKALPERLFVYDYRLYDRYRQPIATLVVLADPSPSWKPAGFRTRSLGCQVAMCVNVTGTANGSSTSSPSSTG